MGALNSKCLYCRRNVYITLIIGYDYGQKLGFLVWEKLTWNFINMQAKNCYFTNFSVTLVQMSQGSKLSAYLR